MRKSHYIFFISMVAAFGGLLFGFDIAIFSGTIPFIQPYYQLSEAQLGWTGSSLYVGCIVGTLLTGYATDPIIYSRSQSRCHSRANGFHKPAHRRYRHSAGLFL